MEGITSPQAYFDMLRAAQDLSRFPIDIVQMEKIEPEYAEDILRQGRLVYERERKLKSLLHPAIESVKK